MWAFTPPYTPRRRGRALSLPLLLLLSGLPDLAQPAAAQAARSDPAFYWGVDVGTATLSGLLQGRLSRIPVTRALVGGLVGGSVIFAGQRLVGTGTPSLRFVGLQSVALGASLTRNVALGHRPLHELTFPLFPLYVQWHASEHPRWSVRVSALAVGGLVQTAREFRTWPDWRESLLAGMPVFAIDDGSLGGCSQYDARGQCVSRVMGHHLLGAIAYTTHPLALSARTVLTHELGHAAQDVRDVVLHAVPASDFVLRTDPVGRWLSRFLVIDAVLPLNIASRAAGPPALDPTCKDLPSFYECETEAMMAP